MDHTYTLTPAELQHARSMETLHRTMDHYFNQLKTEFFGQIALEHGQELSDDLQMTIDLEAKEGKLLVRKVTDQSS